MPLVVNGIILEETPLTSRRLFELHPFFEESAVEFKNKVQKQVSSVGLLFVLQREFAVVSPHDKSVHILGTADATTCVIAVLRHTGSGVAAVIHFDDASSLQGLSLPVLRVLEHSAVDGKLELHLFGGFLDKHHKSEQVVANLLSSAQREHYNIHLATCCVTEMNNVVRGGQNWPVIYGVGINVRTGEIFPASFPSRGPDVPLRSTRIFTRCHELAEIYDTANSLLKVGPIDYSPLRGVDLWLSHGDLFILQNLSTSPEVEPPDFVANLKAAFLFIKEHPYPCVTLFANNQPRYFQLDEAGHWHPYHRSPPMFPNSW